MLAHLLARSPALHRLRLCASAFVASLCSHACLPHSPLCPEYKQVLLRIHGLGTCCILVTGVGSISCVPAELTLHSLDCRCDPELQHAGEAYNPQLEAMLGDLNSEVGDNDNRAMFVLRLHRVLRLGRRTPRSLPSVAVLARQALQRHRHWT